MRARDALLTCAALALTSVSGCRSPSSTAGAPASSSGAADIGPDPAAARPNADGTSAPDPTSPASPPPSAAASAAPPPSSGCPDSAAAFVRGRKAAAERRFDDAIRAFDDAVRARPVDARTRAERGYVYLQRGETTAALTDFIDAQRLTRDASLLAQVWYNLGLTFQKLGEIEHERAAFAVAIQHGGNAAKAKLGSRSSCPALWKVFDKGPEAPIAKGWNELADARQLVNCTLPEPPAGATAAQIARHNACRGCGYGNSDEGDQCVGPGPWAIASGYMHFHVHTFHVILLGGDRYWYVNGADMPQTPAVRVQSGYVVSDDLVAEETDLFSKGGSRLVDGRFSRRYASDAFVRSGGGWSDEMDHDATPLRKDGPLCMPDMQAEVELSTVNAAQMGGTPAMPPDVRQVTTLHSLATGRAVFSVVIYAGKVSVAIEPGRVQLGGACDATVTIR